MTDDSRPHEGRVTLTEPYWIKQETCGLWWLLRFGAAIFIAAFIVILALLWLFAGA